MILPPQRGHERPRVVRRSTSITLSSSFWLSTGIDSRLLFVMLLAGFAMSKSNNKDGAKDRNGRHEQHEHADIEVSYKVCVVR